MRALEVCACLIVTGFYFPKVSFFFICNFYYIHAFILLIKWYFVLASTGKKNSKTGFFCQRTVYQLICEYCICKNPVDQVRNHWLDIDNYWEFTLKYRHFSQNSHLRTNSIFEKTCTAWKLKNEINSDSVGQNLSFSMWHWPTMIYGFL